MDTEACNQNSIVLVRLELLLNLGIVQNGLGTGLDILLVIDTLRRNASRGSVREYLNGL